MFPHRETNPGFMGLEIQLHRQFHGLKFSQSSLTPNLSSPIICSVTSSNRHIFFILLNFELGLALLERKLNFDQETYLTPQNFRRGR